MAKRGDQTGARNPNWRGDGASVEALLNRARLLHPVLGVCADCGKVPATVRHHRGGDRLDNRPENIAPLCRGCHRRAHTALQTHCRHGHEYTPENTEFSRQGWRRCVACRRKRQGFKGSAP